METKQSILLVVAVLIISTIMWILLPTFVTFIRSADLQNIVIQRNVTDVVNATGHYQYTQASNYNAGWSGTVFIILYVLTAALVPLGLIGYFAYKKFKG